MGFLENLLQQGTSAGLGYLSGQRQGEEQRRQEQIAAQQRELQAALIQAQIERTQRQDQPQAPEVNPFLGVPGLDPQLAAIAPGLPSSAQGSIAEQAFPDSFPTEEPDVDEGRLARYQALVDHNSRLPEAERRSPQELEALSYDATGARGHLFPGTGDDPRQVSPYDYYLSQRNNAHAALGEIIKIRQEMRGTQGDEAVANVLRFRGYKTEEELIQRVQELETSPDVGGDPSGETEQQKSWDAAADSMRSGGSSEADIVKVIGSRPVG